MFESDFLLLFFSEFEELFFGGSVASFSLSLLLSFSLEEFSYLGVGWEAFIEFFLGVFFGVLRGGSGRFYFIDEVCRYVRARGRVRI